MDLQTAYNGVIINSPRKPPKLNPRTSNKMIVVGCIFKVYPTIRGEMRFKSNKCTIITTRITLNAMKGLAEIPIKKAGIVEINGPQNGIKLKTNAKKASGNA